MKSVTPLHPAVAAAVVVLLHACDAGSGTHAFIERLGNDTLALEVFTHTRDAVDGTVVVRTPMTRVGAYHADLGPHGITRMEVEWTVPETNPDAARTETVIIDVGTDSATITAEGGPNPGTITVAVGDNTFPLVGKNPIAFGVIEQVLRGAAASGLDEFEFHTVRGGSPRVPTNTIVQGTADTVSMEYFGNPLYMTYSDGHVTGRSGRATTFKVDAEEVDALDLDALARDFAARDARGEGMGVPSPRATVQASVEGANFEVVYSRPAKRGREIWGGLVPYDTVWRTGANAATHFTTDRDIRLGGVDVPAGTYTLWTLFTAGSATLIVNSQTRQWGTQYDAAQDFARIPMEREDEPEVMERFTIAIEPWNGGGMISLSWDRTRFTVAIEVM
ncbi:MAG: DUF2911 domain-containing protein [Gemmatimonadales bacterium]